MAEQRDEIGTTANGGVYCEWCGEEYATYEEYELSGCPDGECEQPDDAETDEDETSE